MTYDAKEERYRTIKYMLAHVRRHPGHDANFWILGLCDEINRGYASYPDQSVEWDFDLRAEIDDVEDAERELTKDEA